MSTYHYLQTRVRLNPAADPRHLRDLDRIVEMARVRPGNGSARALIADAMESGHPMLRHAPWALSMPLTARDRDFMTGPVFGYLMQSRGDAFDIEGAEISDGELRLGVFIENAERPPGGCPGGPPLLEMLLDFLGRVAVGQPGEVVGRYRNEHYAACGPLLWTGAGLRVVTVTTDPHEWHTGWTGEAEHEVPACIPPSVVTRTEGARAFLDEAALRAWLAAGAEG